MKQTLSTGTFQLYPEKTPQSDNEEEAAYESDDYDPHIKLSNGIWSRIYHLVQQFTLRIKYRIIRRYIQSGSLLDIGAGKGTLITDAIRAINKINPTFSNIFKNIYLLDNSPILKVTQNKIILIKQIVNVINNFSLLNP